MGYSALIISGRCLSVLADKVIQTTAVDDRRLRKELQVGSLDLLFDFIITMWLQETYGKLLDSCVTSVSRLDQSTWIRRGTKDSLAVNGRDSPIPRGMIMYLELQLGFLMNHSCLRCQVGRKGRRLAPGLLSAVGC